MKPVGLLELALSASIDAAGTAAAEAQAGIASRLAESEQHVFVVDGLTPAVPGQGAYWVIGTDQRAADGSTAVREYTVSIAHLVAGITDLAVIWQSASDAACWASAGQGAFEVDGRLRLPLPPPEPGGVVTYLPRQLSTDPVLADRLTAAGYEPRLAEVGAAAITEVARGGSAGFVAPRVGLAARLAGALLISEAEGTIGDFRGGYPSFRTPSLVVGAHMYHYLRLSRAIRPVAAESQT
jgi:hypothetical protein